jgi:hypothetical protein
MSLRLVSDPAVIDRARWEDYVLSHPQGNIFQTPQLFFACRLARHYHPVVVASFSGDEMNGLLLAVLQQEYDGLLGKMSARSIIWGGPLSDSDAITREILTRYDEEVGGRAVYSQVRNFSAPGPGTKDVFARAGYDYEPHLNILVDLPADADTFWKGIKRNRKDGINKAKRQGFVFEEAGGLDYLQPFYRLLEESYRSIRLPYPDKSFFAALYAEAPGTAKWFVLKKNDVPVVVLSALVYKGTIYAFYIGTTRDEAILNLRPVDLFYYEVMCWGIRNDCTRFDWMGAGRPDQEYGVRKFKLQYGGEMLELGRFEKVHRPLVLKFAKIGFRCWRMLKR